MNNIDIERERNCTEINMFPLVTAVIPVYNGSNYLKEAVESVFNQTYPNLEIIIVDDGSTDNTWEIIQSYGDKVRGFHKDNGGVSTALNLAIDKMHGEWFAWLSHDDLWMPNKIMNQILFLQKHPNSVMCYTGLVIVNENKQIISNYRGIWYPRGDDLRYMLFFGTYMHGITTMVNKKCFTTIGKFNEKLRCVQDGDMWFRIACKYDICLLNEIQAISRRHSSQIGRICSKKCIKEAKYLSLHFCKTTSMIQLFPRYNSSTPLKKCIICIRYLIIKQSVFIFHNWILPIIRYNQILENNMRKVYYHILKG